MNHAIQLLGSFSFRTDGQPTPLPISAQRLVALLALERKPISRPRVAGTLWPDKPETRAAANLRSTLWRLNAAAEGAVRTHGRMLTLAEHIVVDCWELLGSADGTGSRFLSPSTTSLLAAPPTNLELLSDWDDDWVIVERERVRQHTLRALDRAVTELTTAGRFAEAIELGGAAARLAPLRESTHRVLVEAHLAEGNYGEAVRQYRVFAASLDDAFGVTPSPELRRLLDRPRQLAAMGAAG